MEALRTGSLFAERYRIDRSLGQGGMSQVFAAFDTGLQRSVAIKLIRFDLLSDDDKRRSELKRRFRLEALAAARLRSSHIVTIHDLGIADGDVAYIVEELVEGASLDTLADGEGKVDPRRVVSLAVQACWALSEAHGSGILHRDIKPSNLLVTKTPAGDDHLVLMDFGIAKLIGDEQIERTDPGLVVGTPLYMAPEQLAGEALDPRADLYALGATLYQMLAGHPPFPMASGEFWSVVQQKIEGRPPPPLRGQAAVSPELEAVILRCLKRRPEDRYGSAAELRDALLATPEAQPEAKWPSPVLAAVEVENEDEERAVQFSLGELLALEQNRARREETARLAAIQTATIERTRVEAEQKAQAEARAMLELELGRGHVMQAEQKAREEAPARAQAPERHKIDLKARPGRVPESLPPFAPESLPPFAAPSPQESTPVDRLDDLPRGKGALIANQTIKVEVFAAPVGRKSAKGPLRLIVALVAVAAVVVGCIQLGWWVAVAAATAGAVGAVIAGIAIARSGRPLLIRLTGLAVFLVLGLILFGIAYLFVPPRPAARIIYPPVRNHIPAWAIALGATSVALGMVALVVLRRRKHPPVRDNATEQQVETRLSMVAASPTSSAPPELGAYLQRVGLQITESRGAVLLLSRRPGSLLPDAGWMAVVLEPEVAPEATLQTASFQATAGPLYTLSGTAERPVYVIALLRSPPGAGVYRQWHELSVQRHVHILALSPQVIRAEGDPESATDHLLHLLQSVQRDPFELEGPIASEVDFFGSRAEIQALLRRAVSGKGFGLFGQPKWGTTSLLLRLRAELSERATAWVDLASIHDTTLGGLFDAVHADLADDLHRKARKTITIPIRAAGSSDDKARDVLRSLIDVCHAAGLGRPVIFLDRVDQLTRGGRCDPATLMAFVRELCRVAFSRGTTRAVLVLAGADDDVLLRQAFSHGEVTLDNPFYRSLDREYAPFFTCEETADFLERLGARAGLVFSQAASHAAYRLTGGHKYLTRLLGSELCRMHATKSAAQPLVEAPEVDDCISPLLVRHGDYFAAIFDKAPEATRDVLARLAEGPASIDDLLRLGAPHQARKGQVPAIVFVTKYRLAVEEKRTLRLAVGLAGEWLKLAGAISARKPPPVSPTGTIVMPSAREVSALRDSMSRGFHHVHELKLLVAEMDVVLTSVTSTDQPLPGIILDLVHWSVAHGRFAELRTLVRRQRPHLFED